MRAANARRIAPNPTNNSNAHQSKAPPPPLEPPDLDSRFTMRTGAVPARISSWKLLREFLATPFQQPHDELFFFHGGEISRLALAQIKRALQSTARQCVEIMECDRTLPSGERSGIRVDAATSRLQRLYPVQPHNERAVGAQTSSPIAPADPVFHSPTPCRNSPVTRIRRVMPCAHCAPIEARTVRALTEEGESRHVRYH
jgi:hypothetical protein